MRLSVHTPVVLRAWTRAAIAAGLVLCACQPAPPSAAALRRMLVSDERDLLDADAERRVRAYLDWVRGEYGIDYRVVVAALDGASVAERSNELYEEGGTGASTGGQGLLLLVDPVARQVRVEVGYALEPYLTDVAASRMLSDYLAPYFAADEVGPGIEAAIEALVDKVKPHLRAAAAAGAEPAGSGGGGAGLDLLRDLPDGVLDEETKGRLQQIVVPQADPRQARDLEIALLHRGIYLQEAPLYDDAWRRTARPGAWSPARLREIARQWDRPYEVLVEGTRAIAFYRDAPALGPTFLRREEAGWIIDATHGARAIVYDYSNEGWYAVDDGSPYLVLLSRALPLRRVTLEGGRAAWQLR